MLIILHIILLKTSQSLFSNHLSKIFYINSSHFYFDKSFIDKSFSFLLWDPSLDDFYCKISHSTRKGKDINVWIWIISMKIVFIAFLNKGA